MTASDKGQQKNRMFLRMSEETLDKKPPNTADAMKDIKVMCRIYKTKRHISKQKV